MAQLPVLKRRKPPSRTRLMVTRVATVWTTAKVSLAGLHAAKKGAKAYGAVKDGSKGKARPALKVVAIPVTVAGGVVVWRKLKSDSSNGDDASRPLGPVAHAETVSPPVDAAVQSAGSEAPSS
jgi:hypothetical protein